MHLVTQFHPSAPPVPILYSVTHGFIPKVSGESIHRFPRANEQSLHLDPSGRIFELARDYRELFSDYNCLMKLTEREQDRT